MLRVLLLSSTVGIWARDCWAKELMALFIALIFLLIFLHFRPYRRSSHTRMQSVAMVVPIASMAWALAGGWENEYEKNHLSTMKSNGIDKADDTFSYDSVSMVILHGFIIVPPLLMALFTLLSSLYVWKRTKSKGGHGNNVDISRDNIEIETPSTTNTGNIAPAASSSARNHERDSASGSSWSSWSSWNAEKKERATVEGATATSTPAPGPRMEADEHTSVADSPAPLEPHRPVNARQTARLAAVPSGGTRRASGARPTLDIGGTPGNSVRDLLDGQRAAMRRASLGRIVETPRRAEDMTAHERRKSVNEILGQRAVRRASLDAGRRGSGRAALLPAGPMASSHSIRHLVDRRNSRTTSGSAETDDVQPHDDDVDNDEEAEQPERPNIKDKNLGISVKRLQDTMDVYARASVAGRGSNKRKKKKKKKKKKRGKSTRRRRRHRQEPQQMGQHVGNVATIVEEEEEETAAAAAAAEEEEGEDLEEQILERLQPRPSYKYSMRGTVKAAVALKKWKARRKLKKELDQARDDEEG